MKNRWVALNIVVAGLFLASCATDSELTQKQKEKLARDAEKENRKQGQAQARMMREAGQGGQLKASR